MSIKTLLYRLGVAFTGGVMLFAASAANAVLVTNGDFSLVVPSNGTGNGWTASNNDGSGGTKASGGSFATQHFVLNQARQLATDPTIMQLVGGFVIGEGYLLTGDVESFAPGFGNPAALSFGVAIENLFLQEFTRNQVSPVNGPGNFAIGFVATQLSHMLILTGERNDDDSSYRIDNIAINPVNNPPAIPLPAALPLFIGGLGLMGLLSRRKQRVVA